MDLVAQQSAERRERVLETARRLIAEHGYEGVGMRELARESRCSVPTLYKMFGDKGALLVAAVEHAFTGLLSTIDRSHSERGSELLLAIFEGCYRELVRVPRYSRAVLAVFVSAGQTTELRDVVARHITAEIQVALERMREQGELETWVDARALAERMGSHLSSVNLEWAAGHLSDVALRAALVYGASMMLLGVARGEARREFERLARELQADVVSPRQRQRHAAGS